MVVDRSNQVSCSRMIAFLLAAIWICNVPSILQYVCVPGYNRLTLPPPLNFLLWPVESRHISLKDKTLVLTIFYM